jgi:predicted GNAT superfamily acetyltransferase
VTQAWERARLACDAAGVEIRDLVSLHDVDEAIRVMVETWGPFQIPPQELLHAMEHAGCPFHGAYRGGEMLGFSVGFYGFDADGPHLHSHMLAVVPGTRHRGIGYALKLAQAAAVLDAGVTRIRWTFDPLVARNAYLNLTKLGATADAFHRNFYGEMQDILNRGDRTDRLVVRWDLVRDGALVGPSAREPSADAVVVLDRVGEEPAPGPARGSDPDGAREAIVRVPRDHSTLRESDPDLGAEWREAAALAIESCFAAGLAAVGFSDGYLFAPS